MGHFLRGASVLMAVLKLASVITWPWLAVLLPAIVSLFPLMITLIIVVGGAILTVLVVGVEALANWHESRRYRRRATLNKAGR